MTGIGESETLTGSGRASASTSSPTDVARGQVIGRYVVLDRIGAGAMGVVYAAYDPELDRKVALKLMRGVQADDLVGRARLVREAQALARLSHPNIVAVHDAGTFEDAVWIAMELVDGTTLRRWLEVERPWHEVLAVICAAGRGLAAAHAEGLVHRDFKPDNVMISPTVPRERARVRVMDFGLARVAADGDPQQLTTDPEAQPRLRALDTELTDVGALAGTPAYMPAEAFAGKAIDARADQFAFCVTSWEALYRQRPFAGRDLHELVALLIEGRPNAPSTTRVPAWLRRAVIRGLARDPAERWPSMDALLGVLERGQTRARRRRNVAVAGLAALAIGGIFAARRLDERARIAACETAGAAITQTWSADARARVDAALTAVGGDPSRVESWLDDHAESWQRARTEACLGADVRGTIDADANERIRWCLDEREMELAALVGALGHADRTVAADAVLAAAGLPAPAQCLDVDRLARLPAPPTSDRDTIRRVREELAQAGALRAAGKYKEALASVQSTRARAAELDWPPLHAAAGALEAELHAGIGLFAEAERVGVSAYLEAGRIGAWDVASAAATHLTVVVGERLARYREGEAWAAHAELALAHAGDPDGLREAARLGALAIVRDAAGDREGARALYDRALELEESALGAEHPRIAERLTGLGAVALELGDARGALALHQRALAIWELTLGPDHPKVGTALVNIGSDRYSAGDHAGAREDFARGMAILERALDPDHPLVADGLTSLGAVEYATGNYERARELFERALAIREHALGPEHPLVAGSLNNLAILRDSTGERSSARELYERALAIRERTLGLEHPLVVEPLANLATLYEAQGDHWKARELHERALAIIEHSLGPDHPNVAIQLNNLAVVSRAVHNYEESARLERRALAIAERALGEGHPLVATCLTNLAHVELALGHRDVALPLAERAVAIYDATGEASASVLHARFALALALAETGGDVDRARRLMESVRDGWRAAGAARDGERKEAEQWLAKHGGSR